MKPPSKKFINRIKEIDSMKCDHNEKLMLQLSAILENYQEEKKEEEKQNANERKKTEGTVCQEETC